MISHIIIGALRCLTPFPSILECLDLLAKRFETISDLE
jgi:hypothetical protein